MQEYIHKYLVLYRKLSIPKLGVFSFKDEPAYIDAESGQLFPPKPVLVFEEGLAAGSDRLFFDFLAEEMGVDDIAAIQAFNDYSGKLWAEVQDHELTVFEGLGNFTKSADGHIVFTPEATVYDLIPAIPLGKDVAELHPAEEEAKNDYWWFYAIILLILGLGALAYYYV